jgi:periplasmic divalent cation tolerance protein
MESHCLILTAVGGAEEAARLARLLVERKLAACVQVLPIQSTYAWEGEIKQDSELLLLVKTRASLYADVERLISEEHTYEVPEVVRIPILGGLDRYLAWIDTSTIAKGAP